jgi:peroxiredoxin
MAASMLQASEDVASYQASFDAFMQEMKSSKSMFSKEEQAVMKKAGEDLAATLPNPGIHKGEKVPDFRLKNAFGKEIRLYDELQKGPVVLVFYRGAWCPFCNMHLHVLQENLEVFKKYGAQLITVTPQTPDKSADQIKKDGYPFEVLSDLDNTVMKAYKLYFDMPQALLDIYKKHGLDIEAYNGSKRTGLPIPGSFVIDQKGIVRAMQAQTDYKIRMEPEAIIETLKEIAAE